MPLPVFRDNPHITSLERARLVAESVLRRVTPKKPQLPGTVSWPGPRCKGIFDPSPYGPNAPEDARQRCSLATGHGGPHSPPYVSFLVSAGHVFGPDGERIPVELWRYGPRPTNHTALRYRPRPDITSP